jgi:mannose-6-phosphate isomerase-like protein (cupin superfamily)
MKSRIAITVAILALASPSWAQGAKQSPAPFSSAADIQGLIAKARSEHKDNGSNTIEPLVSIGPYIVNIEYRTGETPPTVHKGQFEYIQVLEGSATLIEGGKLENGKGPPNLIVGTSISGGTSQVISKGDYVVIPPNTPHQFSTTKSPFIMTSVHINKP